MTHLHVLSASKDSEWWDRTIRRLVHDHRDVHFTSAWARAHEGPGVEAYLAVLEDTARGNYNMVCQPMLLRRIDGTPFNDVTWPGYGGPMTDNALPAITDGLKLETALVPWRQDRNVVSEFYMLNPALAAAQSVLLPRDLTMKLERGVTILPAEPAQVLKMMRPNRREAFHKGEGAVVDWCEPDAAQALYDVAMDRLGATERWRLPGHIERLPQDRTYIFGATRDGELQAMAVFLFGADVAYYYLAARAEDCPDGYSDQIIMAGVQLAHERGCTWLHLGGGRTNATDDSLAAYKRSWGGITRPVYSVRRVHDPDAYEALSGTWASTDIGFFPTYRRDETQ